MRYLLQPVFVIALLTIPVRASANGKGASQLSMHGTDSNHGRTESSQHSGALGSVPELDPSAASAAGALLIGGALTLLGRKRTLRGLQ